MFAKFWRRVVFSFIREANIVTIDFHLTILGSRMRVLCFTGEG